MPWKRYYNGAITGYVFKHTDFLITGLLQYVETHFLNYWYGVWSMSNPAVLFLNVIWRQGIRMEMDESWRTESSKKQPALLPTGANSLRGLYSLLLCTPSTNRAWRDWDPGEKGRMKTPIDKHAHTHVLYTHIHTHMYNMQTHIHVKDNPTNTHLQYKHTYKISLYRLVVVISIGLAETSHRPQEVFWPNQSSSSRVLPVPFIPWASWAPLLISAPAEPARADEYVKQLRRLFHLSQSGLPNSLIRALLKIPLLTPSLKISPQKPSPPHPHLPSLTGGAHGKRLTSWSG